MTTATEVAQQDGFTLFDPTNDWEWPHEGQRLRLVHPRWAKVILEGNVVAENGALITVADNDTATDIEVNVWEDTDFISSKGEAVCDLCGATGDAMDRC